VASTAIELVTSLEEGAAASGLGEGFFSTLAPNLFACLREAEDRDVLQVCVAHMSAVNELTVLTYDGPRTVFSALLG
jgi:hypothetical protein